jgi:two-component system response regulator CpxR
MPSSHLLIVDDDQQLAEMLTEYLAPENIVLDSAATGRDGLNAALRADYDLIILDVMLPGLSGFDVLRSFREAGGRTPILMLTARGDDVDRIVGLEMGADDYLAKPFNPRELLARVKAILRRTTDADREDQPEIVLGSVRVDTRRRDAWVGGERLQLTNAEFIILVTLMKSPGAVVSRELLTRIALGRQLLPSDRSLDTHISNLRRKLSAAGVARPAIRSIRSTGYMLISPEHGEQ